MIQISVQLTSHAGLVQVLSYPMFLLVLSLTYPQRDGGLSQPPARMSQERVLNLGPVAWRSAALPTELSCRPNSPIQTIQGVFNARETMGIFMVQSFSVLKWIQNQSFLSFLCNNMTRLAHGLWDGCIYPFLSISFRCSHTSLYIHGGIQW